MPQEGLDLGSPGLAARLVGGAAKSKGCEARLLIDPSDIAKSFLLEKLETPSPECGAQMPLVGDFSPVDLACVQSWVAALVAGGDAGPVGASPDASVTVSKDAGARDAGGMP
jgi:hypothetical protein